MLSRVTVTTALLLAIMLLFSCKGDDPVTDALVEHGDATVSAGEQQMADRHNTTRTGQGTGTLAINAQLCQIAQDQANYMADIGDFTHVDILGGHVDDRATAVGYVYVRIAENVGYDSSQEVLYNGWLASTNHLANIVNPEFQEIGVGRASRGIYQYWSVVFGAR